MSWKVPSGRVRRMVMGKIPESNSHSAMSIGLVFSSASTRIGAPIEICSARAPTILAFSKRVIFGGPTVIFSDILHHPWHSAHTARHTSARRHRRRLHFCQGNNIINFQNQRYSFNG